MVRSSYDNTDVRNVDVTCVDVTNCDVTNERDLGIGCTVLQSLCIAAYRNCCVRHQTVTQLMH